MTMIYQESDADPAVLDGKTVGVIGYGEQGQAFALNLRDSGIAVITHPEDQAQRQVAEAHQIPVAPILEIMMRAQILVITLPDDTMTPFYMENISPHLQRGHVLIFTSGYNVAFGYIEPPSFVDVGLVSPRLNGLAQRRGYLNGEGVRSFVAVGQDGSGQAWRLVLATAAAGGALRNGAVEITFEQEAELDLFIHEAVIPVFHHLMTTAAKLLMKSGYPAEAVLPDLYLNGRFGDYLRQTETHGLLNALQQGSQIGLYAALSRLERFNDGKLERLMEICLEEIQRGDLAREWSREQTDGHPRLNKLLKTHRQQDLWDWEQQTLELLNVNG
ncbi:MAG: NAD(P)-binding domain-containing protein [Anaerolineae bacterium]|jgi:ketol-acid reductoisomerase|nr:NAD(P)-binding domain-containing protein [Anaerolineae bacterium]